MVSRWTSLPGIGGRVPDLPHAENGSATRTTSEHATAAIWDLGGMGHVYGAAVPAL